MNLPDGDGPVAGSPVHIGAHRSELGAVRLGVTDAEDFPNQERVQRNLEAGALDELVYGKMEPALANYHQAIAKLLADAGALDS